MATVLSTWTSIPVPVDGLLSAREWAGAGNMPIPAGYLMVKNDAANLYIALDIVGDSGNSPGTSDYYWLVIDSDRNGAVTPDRDQLFSPWPGNPNRMGLWLMAGPNATWPAPNDQVVASATRMGFGASPHCATAHRIWELRLSLTELGITIDPNGPPPIVKFGLRIASSSPTFTYEYPANPLSTFQNFHQIILATHAPLVAAGVGVVIASVGLIPATKIGVDGYATIAEPYFVQPDEAAFSGTLNLIGNIATLPGLWTAGARKYRVLHRYGNSTAEVVAATWAPIRQSWANYRWTGATYVWESFGPDMSNMYPLVDPMLDYATKALLFQWNTSTEPNNLHQFKIEFFNAAGAAVVAPAQILTLRLDNRQPNVKVLKIMHNGSEISPCAIETMEGPTDGVQLVFTAFDPEGSLNSYALTAEWGAGQSTVIASDSYANPANRTPTHTWQGVTSITRPVGVSEWSPPVTCAYRFRIGAVARVTNGYSFPLYLPVTDFRMVTLIKPGVFIAMKPPVAVIEQLPFGFATRDKISVPGIEPKVLGHELPHR